MCICMWQAVDVEDAKDFAEDNNLAFIETCAVCVCMHSHVYVHEHVHVHVHVHGHGHGHGHMHVRH